jgi:hypothetical protein
MRSIKYFLLVIVVVAYGCGGSQAVQSTSIRNLEELAVTGYHATGQSCMLDQMMAIPVREQVVCINSMDGVPAWKYENTVDRAWTCVWVVSGNNQFLAGFESSEMEKVVRLSRGGRILELIKSEEFGSKPVWVEDRWWRMTETEFFADDAGFEIPESIPVFIYANGLFVYQTVEGIVEARNSNGIAQWSWAPSEDNFHGVLSDLGWCIAFVSSDTLYAINPESGELLWEIEADVSVMPKEIENGMVYADGKFIKKVNLVGEVYETMELRWNALDFEVADDGVAVLMPDRLMTFTHGWELLEDLYINPQIDELYVLPENRVAVCGYSQIFYQSNPEKE